MDYLKLENVSFDILKDLLSVAVESKSKVYSEVCKNLIFQIDFWATTTRILPAWSDTD
jgi:hypothetical protein